MTTPSQSATITSRLQQAQPAWSDPASRTRQRQDATISWQTTYYWPLGSMALAQAGDGAGASSSAGRIQSSADGHNRPWPFTPATAGQLILALSGDGAAFLPGG